jgi:PAS domain-containing protein
MHKMRESFAMGKPFQETSRVRRVDGIYRWMLNLKVPVFDRVGNLIKWNGSSIDIDDRMRAEDQLLKSAHESQRNEFYFAEAQRLDHIGIWVYNPAVGFDYCSRELFVVYGMDPERDPPTLDEYLAYVHPHDREFMAALIKRMLAEGWDVTSLSALSALAAK